MTDTRWPSRWISRVAEMFVWGCALTVTVFLLRGYALLPTLEVFGNDEVHYFPNMQFKLAEDGRWLDMLLHDFLRSVPLGVWAYVWFLGHWLLFFRVARSLAFETPYALLVTATILLAAPFFALSPWPASAAPALVIYLAASFFVARGAPYPIVYVACGILMFGAYQTYYLLLPLLFLHRFLSPRGEGEPVWVTFFKHMTWWVLGAVAGVLVMSTILWVTTGHFGMQPAEWRRAQPAHDLAGLVRNIEYVRQSFRDHLLLLLHSADAFSRFFVSCFLAAGILHARSLFARRYALLLLIAVMVSFFAMSVPMAPIIQPRSTMAMSTAMVLLFALMTGSSGLGRVLSSLMLVFLGYYFSVNGEAYLTKHKTATGFVYHKLKELIPEDPADYSVVAVYGVSNDPTWQAAVFNSTERMHSIVMALGARKYRDCRQGRDTKFCKTIAPSEPIATVPYPPGQLTFSLARKNIAVITYTE